MGEIHTFLGAPVLLHDSFENCMFGVLKSFQTSPWGRSSHRFHCQHMIYPICSQPGVYIFADCAENWLNKTVQISSNPSLILSNFSYFSPIHNNSTDSPSRTGSLTRRSPICRCPRRNVSNDRHRNRRNHLRCRRYRRPSWVGRWGRNHGQNGGLIKQRTKMGISCRLYPILPSMKLPPLTPWF